MDLTQKEIEILKHTLGYNYTPRHPRNHYFANEFNDQYPAIKSLIEKGLMEAVNESRRFSGGMYYKATPAGEVAAKLFSTRRDYISVGKLIKILKGFPEHLEVVLAKDIEGNDFSPLIDDDNRSPSVEFFERTSAWRYELICVDEPLDESDEHEAALVLWPTN